jgi:DNA-binding NarL/FixJ family response regulator
VRARAPGAKLVVFALSEADDDLIACAEAGIGVFVGRDGSPAELVDAVDQAWRGAYAAPPHLTTLLLRRLATLSPGHAAAAAAASSSSPLTRREREIMPLLERGLSNKEIARLLGTEPATIKNHVHNILGKLQVRRRAQLAARRRTSDAPRPDTNGRKLDWPTNSPNRS